MAEQLFCRFDNQKFVESLMLTSHSSPPSTTFAEIVFPFLVKQVQDLRLQLIELDDDLAITLGHALCQNETSTRHLTDLRIQFSKTLSTHGCVELAKGLSNNPQLSILRLCFRSHFYTERVDYDGVFHHLCSSLPSLTSLTSLFMHINLTSCDQVLHLSCSNESQPITPTPAESLMLALTNHPTLLEVNLRFSIDYGLHGLKTIARHLGNRNIKIPKINLGMVSVYIKFPNKNASDEDKKAWSQMEIDCFGDTLVESLKSNFHLCDLRMCYITVCKWDEKKSVHFTDETAWVMNITTTVKDHIDFFTHLNKKGRRLLHHSRFSDVSLSLWCSILAGCGNSASLVFGLLREITPNGNLLLVEMLCT